MKDVFFFLIYIVPVVLKIHWVTTDFMDTKCDRRHFGWGQHSDLKLSTKYFFCRDLSNDIFIT